MRFRYLFDPLFVLCLVGYAANRWLIRPAFDLAFFHGYFNDLICIPFCVPIMLLLMRAVRLRRHDGPPRWDEIIVPLLIWTVMFELWLPMTSAFEAVATADHVDVVCYASGACVAAVWWRWYYGRRDNTQPREAHGRQRALHTSECAQPQE